MNYFAAFHFYLRYFRNFVDVNIRRSCVTVFITALVWMCFSFPGSPASAQDDLPLHTTLSTTAPIPPMGWAGWNRYLCDYDESTIREQADALVSSGMRELGYRYVLIQECIAPRRNPDGTLFIDPVRFPHGLKALVDFIHSRNLKAGVYTDVGAHTCFGEPFYQGSFDHEDIDAASFASWSFDFIEMDYCDRPPGHSGQEIYERMAASIRKTGRPASKRPQNRKNQLTPGRTPSLLRNLRTFGKALSIYGGGERGPVTFPAFKAGDAFLRGTGGGFDFHTPPPNG